MKKQIGKRKMFINSEHKLPQYLRQFPMYDTALPRICRYLKNIDKYLKVIDIGANIGDTVFLITDNVQGHFLCIEGDEEYVDLLAKNIKQITNSKITIKNLYCSDSQNNKFNVIKKNGTAMLNQDKSDKININKFVTLDNIIERNKDFRNSNLIKIDTDGFEINVIKGALNFIKNTQPMIFFEFDPVFYKQNNHKPLYIFEILHRAGYKKALFYDNFGLPIEVVDISDIKRIEELMKYIDMEHIFYFDVLIIHENKYKKYKDIFDLELLNPVRLKLHEITQKFILTDQKFLTTQQQFQTTQQQLQTTQQQFQIMQQQFQTTQQQLQTTQQQLQTTQQQFQIMQQQLIIKQNQLDDINNSRGYKVGLKLQKVFKILFPTNSLRRRNLIECVNCVKKGVELFRKVKTFLYILLTSNYYKFNKKERNINLKAKKIVYVGHSYHNKTKSTIFLQEYLNKFFDVEVISDDSWNGKEYPDLSFINKENYVGVVFFQILPPKDILNKIDNDNIIFCPMYDQSGKLDFNYWNQYRDLKILNFSKTLHDKLEKWGFESMYIQYFPEVKGFFPGKLNEIFFWQRLEKINIKTIIALLGEKDGKVHIHKAMDPKQAFTKPTVEEEKKHNITYSKWFDTREEMQELIKSKGIYIAPREYEGIGQSFLEAMSMGKAVIAVNNPTMNEYIKDGETGYLFDLENLQEIDLKTVAQVQKNTYNYMRDGRKRWLKERKKIIDFIKKNKW